MSESRKWGESCAWRWICKSRWSCRRVDKDRQCDFGQYASLWANHQESCRHIIRITESYIVSINKDNKIDWETTKAHDDRCPAENKTAYERILSQCSITEHKPLDGLSEDRILSFKTIVGESIVNCLEGNFTGAGEILLEAEKFRMDRIVEKSREWYLSYTMLLSLLFILLAIEVNEFKVIEAEEMLQRINCGAWAIAGACLSIILRSGRMRHASYAGKRLHIIESASRLMGGCISGLIAYLGVRSGILFANFVMAGNQQYIYALLPMLAGASERFAPSIISKIENSSSIHEESKGVTE